MCTIAEPFLRLHFFNVVVKKQDNISAHILAALGSLQVTYA